MDKKEFTLLYKKNCFISGMKTTYLNTQSGIQYLSYVKCYFGKSKEMDKYNNFQKTLNEPSFCIKIICFPFKFINISIKSVIFIFTSIKKQYYFYF